MQTFTRGDLVDVDAALYRVVRTETELRQANPRAAGQIRVEKIFTGKGPRHFSANVATGQCTLVTAEEMLAKGISRELAEQCLAAVKEQFKAYAADDCACGQPLLQEPGVQCDGWAIVWECHAPYQWTYRAFGGGFDEELYQLAAAEFGPERARDAATDDGVARPDGVYAEAVNSCALGLYPDQR